jgi:hypothetical protein
MAELKQSWTLKEEVRKLHVSSALMKEIDIYIMNKDRSCTGKAQSFSNLMYRANLHFIIDNHKDEPRVIKELKTVNSCI